VEKFRLESGLVDLLPFAGGDDGAGTAVLIKPFYRFSLYKRHLHLSEKACDFASTREHSLAHTTLPTALRPMPFVV
jgi:hypothetical protein